MKWYVNIKGEWVYPLLLEQKQVEMTAQEIYIPIFI